MLSQEQIIKNAKKYIDTATAQGFMPEGLINELGGNFIAAPATAFKSYYNAFEGGLIDHLLRTASIAIKHNDVASEDLRQPKASIIKVCFLSQIGKAHLFSVNTNEYTVKNQGKMYEYLNNSIPMSVGERSLYMATKHGVSFSQEEWQAILNLDKDDTDKQASFFTHKLGKLLKYAHDEAIDYAKNLQKPTTNE